MGNNCNTGYSKSPAPVDNTVLWTAPVTGDVHEFPTPVVVNGIVYYPQNMGGDSLYALNAATGDLIWKYRAGGNDDAVTVMDGLLYSPSDSLYCLDALTGERIWATFSANVYGNTPVVTDGRVYCGSHTSNCSDIYCLDAYTGAEIWRDTLSGGISSCMAVLNDMVFIPTYAPGQETPLYAVDAITGAIIWENTDAFAGYWDSSPIVVDSAVYINGHDGKLFFADQNWGGSYHCLEAPTGSTIWSLPGYQHGSSGITDGVVFYGESYFPDGAKVYALDCETGSELWSYQTGGMFIQSSPAITDGVVYIAGTDWNLPADLLYVPVRIHSTLRQQYLSSFPSRDGRQ